MRCDVRVHHGGDSVLWLRSAGSQRSTARSYHGKARSEFDCCCWSQSSSYDGPARPTDSGFFDIPVDHLYAAPVIYDYLEKKKLNDLVVVSPDVGGLKMAYAYSQHLESDLAIIAKRRKSATEVESVAIIGEVRGRNVLLVDDLTETAGTLTKGAELLKKKGAKRIIACVSHAILGDTGIERLRKSAIDELITTDTVVRPTIRGVKITTLSVAGLLGEAIKRIHNNSSVTSLFESKGGRTS